MGKTKQKFKLHVPGNPWHSLFEQGPPATDGIKEVMQNGEHIQRARYSATVGWLNVDGDDPEIVVTHWRFHGVF